MADPAYVDGLLACQRNRNNLVTVQVSAQHTGRNRVAVQSDQKIEQGGSVVDTDAFAVGQGA
ncbi:hypothetical protein D3C73_1659490 [compost metagenome]